MAYRLLVVAGDNPDLHNLKQHLGDDVTISQVTSANEALWEVRSTPPHAIVADMTLPDMSGLDLAEILPNFGVSTRVVLVSRSDDQDARRQASDFGVYGFLGGALAPEQLRDEIREALRQGLHDEQNAPPPEPEPEPEPAPAPPPRRTIVDEPAIERIVRPPTAEERAEQAPPRPAAPAPTPPRPPARKTGPDLGKPYEPPDRSRRAAAPDPAERGGLAARARQQVQASQASQASQPAPTPPAPQPAPAPSEPAGIRHRGAGTLVLTSDNLTSVNRILSDLSQMLGAQCAMLTDRAGMTMAQHGSTEKLPMMILLPLLSTSFSTAGEVGRQLREEDATTLYIHDGARYGLYCFDIVQRFLLVVVFDKQIAATKIGSVWVEGRGAIRKLREALS
jgi:DNA-binding NarL/FixJ family response regulator